MSGSPTSRGSRSPNKQQDKPGAAGPGGFGADAGYRYGPQVPAGPSTRTRPRTPPRPAHSYSEPAWRTEEDEARRDLDSDDDDEFYCEYDSTWETDESPTWSAPRTKRRTRRYGNHKFEAFERAARDMQMYRHGESKLQMGFFGHHDKPNLDFYLGKKRSKPDGFLIQEFHDNWFGDYHRLEYVHTFIQWLFPLEEPGMNSQASMLTKAEIEAFVVNPVAKKNLLISYKVMLDFYGIELCNDHTGEVSKARNWRERFDNLNCHTHNNLRITRIIKCLGILGFRHFQAPLVKFFLEETLVHKQLPNVKESVLNYFMFAVLEREKRRSLINYAYSHYYPKEEFVWCPKKVQMRWQQSPARQVPKPRNRDDTFNRMGFR